MFKEFDDITLLFIILAAIFIYYLIWHEVIKSATKSNEINKKLENQNKLLKMLLEKYGVDVSKTPNSLKDNKKEKVPTTDQEKLQQRYDRGEITFEQYQSEWKKLES